MVFYPPSWAPKLPEIPDSITVAEFMLNDDNRRIPIEDSRTMFTCGLSGKEYHNLEIKRRVDWLAAGLAKEMGWEVNKGTEWDKVVGVFAMNTIDTIPLAWAISRFGGIDSPANAAYSPFELEHQLRDGGAKCVFTCLPLLETTEKVCDKLKIPRNRIFLLELPKAATEGMEAPKQYKTVDHFVAEGKKLAKLEPLKMNKGDGAKRCAFLCYSSGTSGLPKGVMISHRNVIANTLQVSTYDDAWRSTQVPKGEKYYLENCLGLLPMSHIYGLIVVSHATMYLGDGVIVLPKFEFTSCMTAIQNFKINTLFLVPPIIIQMLNNKDHLKENYDFSHVRSLFTGAAPLGQEGMHALQKMYPWWHIRQGYGLTETCTVVCSTSPFDIYFGTCGSLLPGYEAKLVTPEGNEITGYEQPGELWAKSPSVVLGYLNRPDANKETFIDGYMRTGDEAMIKKSPEGHEHIIITDRIKELIKVSGMQVAPAELEAHLLTHDYVDDVCITQVPNERTGEAPKAWVVKSKACGNESDEKIIDAIKKHVEKEKSKQKWITGGVTFIDVIPKSPSGKILRRLLRDKQKEIDKTQKTSAKL